MIEELGMTPEEFQRGFSDFISNRKPEKLETLAIYKVVLIRGLRNGDDLYYEDDQLKFINDFKKNTDVVFFRCDEQFQHISSSDIRNLQSFQPDSGDKYLI